MRHLLPYFLKNQWLKLSDFRFRIQIRRFIICWFIYGLSLSVHPKCPCAGFRFFMARAMFTIIGAMAELESSLISERVAAGMKAAAARGKHLGRPPIPRHVVAEIKTLATSTDLSIRKIHEKVAGKASRSVVGEITKRVRLENPTVVSPAAKVLICPEAGI